MVGERTKVTVTVEAVLYVDHSMTDSERVGNDLAAELVLVCKGQKAKVVERRVTCKD